MCLRTRRCAHLKLPFQKSPFRRRAFARQRGAERLGSVADAAELEQQLPADGEQQVIATELRVSLQRRERRKRFSRTTHCRECDHPVQRDDGERLIANSWS
jgi:hypothetical protein